MQYEAINTAEKLTKFTEHWSPKIIAQMNEYHFKLVKLRGEFVWHKHDETDETFMVIEGLLTIKFRDGEVTLGPGDLFVVPKGVEHKPSSETECSVMLIEPAGTVNTGDAGGEMTATAGVWI